MVKFILNGLGKWPLDPTAARYWLDGKISNILDMMYYEVMYLGFEGLFMSIS